ncbi:MAG: hypothetical protein C0467_27655 [Planctomycetaceae bacterium]|nr:hypothetical protein [Planctomycetaceae bacterium]
MVPVLLGVVSDRASACGSRTGLRSRSRRIEGRLCAGTSSVDGLVSQNVGHLLLHASHQQVGVLEWVGSDLSAAAGVFPADVYRALRGCWWVRGRQEIHRVGSSSAVIGRQSRGRFATPGSSAGRDSCLFVEESRGFDFPAVGNERSLGRVDSRLEIWVDGVPCFLPRRARALTQFFKPENYFTVREALIQAGRSDLIGGCDGLIPVNPPKEAIEARRRQANDDHYHTVANPAKGEQPGERGAELPKNKGYRPGRTSQQRRDKNRKRKPGD